MRVTEWLKLVVVDSGLTVTEASRKLGITRPALSRMLNGNADLSIELALKMERELAIHAREVLISQLDEKISDARSTMATTKFRRQYKGTRGRAVRSAR